MIIVDGRDYPWREGMTVAELINKIDGRGHCAVVRLNDRTISRPHFESTLVPDHAKIFLLPMIAGG
ncbi:MAG: hypothetical protein B6I22_00915 [Desulfobacteraceae bacterium 4572_123]|nr:MAG: hypothetical protein B6I22_00915 [Desulfobacteraceae bacterium 4572_123]